MSTIFEEAKKLQEELVAIRRTIHKCPEVGPSLPKTKAFVMDKLKEFGYEPQEICESGIVAVLEGDKPGKTFLLRADMDALAIRRRLRFLLHQIIAVCMPVVMICIPQCF